MNFQVSDQSRIDTTTFNVQGRAADTTGRSVKEAGGKDYTLREQIQRIGSYCIAKLKDVFWQLTPGSKSINDINKEILDKRYQAEYIHIALTSYYTGEDGDFIDPEQAIKDKWEAKDDDHLHVTEFIEHSKRNGVNLTPQLARNKLIECDIVKLKKLESKYMDIHGINGYSEETKKEWRDAVFNNLHQYNPHIIEEEKLLPQQQTKAVPLKGNLDFEDIGEDNIEEIARDAKTHEEALVARFVQETREREGTFMNDAGAQQFINNVILQPAKTPEDASLKAPIVSVNMEGIRLKKLPSEAGITKPLEDQPQTVLYPFIFKKKESFGVDHIVLIGVDFEKNEVFYYDSQGFKSDHAKRSFIVEDQKAIEHLNDENDEELLVREEHVSTKIKTMREDLEDLAKTLFSGEQFSIKENCERHQKDPHNCGVFVLSAMDRLASGATFENTVKDLRDTPVKTLRKQLADRMIKAICRNRVIFSDPASEWFKKKGNL